MLYLFIGNVREGKTISTIVEAKKFYDEGYTIYSNTPLSFPYIKLERKDILEWQKTKLNLPDKCVFVIDEIHAWFDSRNSASSNNQIFSYFMTQLGKFTSNKQKGLTIIGTTQFFSQLDIRGRRICDTVITCKKIEEKENEYVIVMRKHQKNYNLILKTVKREFIKFTKEDFDLYDTQATINSCSHEEIVQGYVTPKIIRVKT